jgi:small-conductance mechanosensitive channel
MTLGLIDQTCAIALGLVGVALALRFGRQHGGLLVGLGVLDLLTLLALGSSLSNRTKNMKLNIMYVG